MDICENGTAAEIFDTFGTHYMIKAVFVGLKRWSSTLDIRNAEVSKSLAISLAMKVAETEPVLKDGKEKEDEEGEKAPDSGSAKISDQSETTEKIYKSLEITTSNILGETPRSNDDEWMTSIYRNPALINFSLSSIVDLILDPVKAANVQKEADRRIHETGV